MAKKFNDTRSNINSDKLEEKNEWSMIKIRKETRDELKEYAFKQKKEMQEIADIAVQQYLNNK